MIPEEPVVFVVDDDRAVREAKSMGLPVSTEMPEDVYTFMQLFPQPSVQYTRAPYRAGQGATHQ